MARVGASPRAPCGASASRELSASRPAFVLASSTVYAIAVPLLIVLRVLVAIALILQGGIGASAYVSMGHHCAMAGHHGGQAPKCPCCPAKSLADCADACTTVAALPCGVPAIHVTLPPAPRWIERARYVEGSIDTPLRPPIA